MPAITALLVLLCGLALAWLIASAHRYRRMVEFRTTIRDRCDGFLARGRAEGHLAYPPAWLAAVEAGRAERGIVMCAGGPSLLTQAWTNLDVLRNHHGCTLPVVLFHAGEEEMPEACRRFFEQSIGGLRCVDATRVPDRPLQPSATNLHGFELKPFSLFNAPFDEVLFIDADSVPLHDPASLFDSPGYLEHGNLFWPESCLLSTLAPHAGAWSPYSLRDGRERRNLQGVNPRIFDHLRLPRPNTPERIGFETESGQILLDRRRCFDAVALCWFLCSRPHHLRLYFYGDTEAYRLAFGVAGRHFNQVRHASHHAGWIEHGEFVGKAVIPRDESGEPAFLHQMHRKPGPEAGCPPLTHVTHDAAVDHPRPRRRRGISMLARVDDLDHLEPIGGPAARIDELVRKSHEAFLARIDEAHLPAAPRGSWLDRRILPW